MILNNQYYESITVSLIISIQCELIMYFMKCNFVVHIALAFGTANLPTHYIAEFPQYLQLNLPKLSALLYTPTN